MLDSRFRGNDAPVVMLVKTGIQSSARAMRLILAPMPIKGEGKRGMGAEFHLNLAPVPIKGEGKRGMGGEIHLVLAPMPQRGEGIQREILNSPQNPSLEYTGDVTRGGKGHTTRVVGNQPRVTATIQL